MTTKRTNKTKEEIKKEMEVTERVKAQKIVVAKIFEKLGNQKSVYDAQTVVSALAGYITADLNARIEKVKISELEIDLSKEKESEITVAMREILEEIKDEPAEVTSSLLERFSQAFTHYGAQEFLKGPISAVDINKIINN